MNKGADIFLRVLVLLFAISTHTHSQTKRYAEKYRPLYHFSPGKGWIGDPDGLVLNNGTYHLFWWGHATSTDLVHWQEQPKPMKGDDGTFSYFSGSVAVDENNTTGFGKNSMVAVFTRHLRGDSLPETQAISVSNDKGVTFNYYDKNPVLDIKKIFFRDPQVFWYKPGNIWKMVVTLPNVQQIHIYESADLKEWKFCSSFSGLGAKNSFWECPDLYELPVAGTKTKKWVLMIGRGPNKVQYFVGDFDGNTFVPDKATANYLNTGAGISGVLYDDFEKGFSANWTQETAGFAISSGDGGVSDYLGARYLGTPSKVSSVGKIASKPFIIRRTTINFLIAGGNRANTSINLVIDGKVKRSATGDNTTVFKWNGWDVHDLIGKQAYFEIVDSNADTTNAFIAIDHIMFSNQLMDQHLEHALWLDYGPDHYATRTWRNYDTSRNQRDSVFAIGWMGNWEYANKVPTQWGKGFESLPRLLALKQTNAGYRIMQQPIPQLNQLRGDATIINGLNVRGVRQLPAFKPSRNSYEIRANFKPTGKAVFGFNLLAGEGRKLVLSYNPLTSSLVFDRTNCTDFISDTIFTRLFAKKIMAPVSLQNGKLQLRIFIDQSSIEVFTNDGEVVLSAATFPSENQLGIELFSDNGETQFNLEAWELKSIWN
jgi:fructan beta-fructosidase